jgi:hypothetical protein
MKQPRDGEQQEWLRCARECALRAQTAQAHLTVCGVFVHLAVLTTQGVSVHACQQEISQSWAKCCVCSLLIDGDIRIVCRLVLTPASFRLQVGRTDLN